MMEVPIRVVARVKPCLPEEENERCLQVAPTASQVILGFDDNFFDFDAVFGEDVSQKEFYNSSLSDMVANFFQGFNTTVLTYGQQGSGKTYTMTGPDFLWAMNEEEFGVLPQAVRHIFKMMNDSPGREYRVHISYLIIHQETVYDLLASGHPLSPLNVLEDNGGNIVIPGLTVVDCSNISEVLNCLEAGLLQKHSASTQGFDFSSGHTLFNLTLEHRWSDSDNRIKYLFSRISFVDLGGVDVRFGMNCNEIGNVSSGPLKNNYIYNSDLKILGNVLQCLVNKSYRGLIPYRDSRLTHILKDSFGGNSMTLMICCLSPLKSNYESSYNTLKLGALTRYAVNYPILNLFLQNSIQSLSSSYAPSNITNTCSSRQSGNLSATPPSHNTTIKSNSNIQQNGFLHHPYAAYQSAFYNGTNTTFGVIDELPLHENDEIFKVQFAASQWHQLVSSAESLLADILQSGSVSPTEKSKIQSWLCMKAEADECIGADIAPLPTENECSRPLEVIEELSEPNDAADRSTSSHNTETEETSSSTSSLGESFYSQLEDLKEKFFALTVNLINEANARYVSCEGISENLSRKNSCDKKSDEHVQNKAATQVEECMSISEDNSSRSSLTDCENIKKTNERELKKKENNSENVNICDREINYESDKENLARNFGSRLSLISKTSSTSSSGTKTIRKKKLKSRKMVETFKRMSSIGRSGRRESKAIDSRLAENGDSCSSSVADINTFNKEMVASFDREDEEESLGVSSERELLKRVSSKFMAVSKGPSKCVINLRTKSCQLKRSIRSHIFKKRNKVNQISNEIHMDTLRTSLPKEIPCTIRRVSDELKVDRERLEELNATIKVKEEFIQELKRGGSEAEMTRKKCESRMREIEIELEEIKGLHSRAQNKMLEFADNEGEKVRYRDKVYDYSRKMNHLKRKIASLSKVASISESNDSNIKELEKSIHELRAEQEELHTKLREKLQRKEQLEQQILRDDRCARNPLFSSSKIMDEEDSDKEMETEAPVADQTWSPNVIFPFGRKNDPEAKNKQKLMPKQKKRKLANSAGDSQSETSMRGDSRLGFREKGKNGPLDKSYSDHTLEEMENQNPDFIRKEIGMLRIARDNLILKRQKIDKRLRKGRTRGNGCEEERKLLEYDEAVEGLDSVIERKNEVLTGKATQIQPFAPLLTKNELEERLKCLPIAELHFLLVKFFSRIIDIRIEFRKHELEFAELENQFDEQNRYICNLKAAYQQASLEMERRLTTLQRDYECKISYLLRQFNEGTTGYGVHEMKLLEMERQLYYYRKLSRELKEKLREYLNQGGSRPSKEIESVPGPSGIKSHIRDYDPTTAFFPRTNYSSPSDSNQVWPRRGRRFALHANGTNLNTTRVTRQKNKLIIQQKGEDLTS